MKFPDDFTYICIGPADYPVYVGWSETTKQCWLKAGSADWTEIKEEHNET